MKRLAIATALVFFAASMLFADELTVEKRVFTGLFAVDHLQIASGDAGYGAVVQTGGRMTFLRLSEEGVLLRAFDLPDVISAVESRIAFDGRNFVVVVREDDKRVSAIWIEPDDITHGPLFVGTGEGLSLNRSGDFVALVVRDSLQLFAANVRPFLLKGDFTATHLADLQVGMYTYEISTTELGGDTIIAWSEGAEFPCSGCGTTGGPSTPTEALRFARWSSSTNSIFVAPVWSSVLRYSPTLVAGAGVVLWVAERWSSPSGIEVGLLSEDAALSEPPAGGAIVAPFPVLSYAVVWSGTRFLLVRDLRIASEAPSPNGRTLGLEARWLNAAGGSVASGAPFIVDPTVKSFSLASAGDGRVAVIYSKYKYTATSVEPQPDVFIRFAGTREEPRRSRALRR